MEEWITEELLEKAAQVAKKGICDRCLGRMFGKISTGMTNDVRGAKIRDALRENGREGNVQSPCPLCDDVFDLMGRFADAVAESINSVESDNFLVGSRVDPSSLKKEKEIIEEFELKDCESIKTELNREIGKLALPMIHRPVEFKAPQVVACIDTRFAEVSLDISPVFIYGRYNKLSREIPQTVWPCRVCHGKGCPKCNGTGKMYQTSVQEEIGNIALEMSGGKEHFFHGMGREDIDACMLGTGRPFVLEISQPRIRDIDLDELEARANESILAQYHGLHFVPRSAVAMYKESDPDKTYRAQVVCEGRIDPDKVKETASKFVDVCLDQRTPQRVEHRRADLVRKRTVYWIKAENITEDSFDLVLKTQSGTYIKEFVSGDEGRTQPNFSETYGAQCKVDLLDVQEIDFRDD